MSSVSIELATLSPLPPSSSEVDITSLEFTNQNGDEARPPSVTATNVETEDIALSRISTMADFGRSDRNVLSLAPVDGGIQAWSFVRIDTLKMF